MTESLDLAFNLTPENTKMTNIIKIESFLNDQSYSDLIEYSANFNARLCIERRLRMPFLDPQTGVAQKHSNLFMKRTQRIPGLQEGQIYTYPSPRWRCKRNTASFNSRPFYRFRSSVVATNHNLLAAVPNPMVIPPSTIINTESDANDFQALIDAESNSADTDSKDSHVKDENMSKEWFYDDVEANDINSEQGDSDFDYNVNGYKRKKKPVTTRKTSRKPKETNSRSSGSSNRNNKSRKSSRSSKSTKNDQTSFADVEPRGFADIDNVQGDLFDDKFGAYRSF